MTHYDPEDIDFRKFAKGETVTIFCPKCGKPGERSATSGSGYKHHECQPEPSSASVGAQEETNSKPLTYEQEVHALLWAAASNTESLLGYFEAQAATESGDAKKLTLKCIEWKRDDLRRIRELIPQALVKREASVYKYCGDPIGHDDPNCQCAEMPRTTQPQGSDNSAGPGVPPSAELKDRAKKLAREIVHTFVPRTELLERAERICEITGKLESFASSIQEEARQQIEAHTQHAARFLNDMYATMIDPLAEGEMKVAEICAALLKVARAQRQQLYDHEQQLAEARAQVAPQTELDKAVARWVEAKRQQVLREDTKGDLQHEVRRQERDVEDEIAAAIERASQTERK